MQVARMNTPEEQLEEMRTRCETETRAWWAIARELWQVRVRFRTSVLQVE